MRVSLLSPVALALSGVASGRDFSTSGDRDVSIWDLASDEHVGARDVVFNEPAKRQAGWNPPSSLVSPLRQVWDHCLATYAPSEGGLFAFNNYGWDQIMAPNSRGNINICVRWDSNTPVNEAQRAQIARGANVQYQKWFSWLYGWGGFPFQQVSVNIVAWAVRDRSLLQGSTAGLDIHTDRDVDGIPQCAPACGRYFNRNDNYPNCPGGAARRYDQSLWITDGFQGGVGGDWGQRMGREHFMTNINSDNFYVYQHEIGHTFGLDDFYDWKPSGVGGFIMSAGTSPVITEFDGWMLRNWWYELSRSRGWSTGTTPPTPPTSPPTTPPTNPPTSPPTGTVPRWGQCGGQGYTGPTICAAPYSCVVSNQWYSQCL